MISAFLTTRNSTWVVGKVQGTGYRVQLFGRVAAKGSVCCITDRLINVSNSTVSYYSTDRLINVSSSTVSCCITDRLINSTLSCVKCDVADRLI